MMQSMIQAAIAAEASMQPALFLSQPIERLPMTVSHRHQRIPGYPPI
jgi:hypothetical protein